jgi:hypothetical protein
MDLNALAQLGKVEREIVLNDKLTVKVHTLSVAEQQRALASMPTGIEDDATKFSYFQEAMLVHATDTINGEVVDKVTLAKFYKDLQYPLLTALFSQYLELSQEQGKVLDELKKK